MSKKIKQQLITQLSNLSLEDMASIILQNKIENLFVNSEISIDQTFKFKGDLEKLKPLLDKEGLKGYWRIANNNLFEQLIFPIKGNINFYKTGTILIQSVPIKLRKSVENKILKAINIYKLQNNE
jgi:hypothetical protein